MGNVRDTAASACHQMSRASQAGLAGQAAPASATRVLDAFRLRIGEDRFAVWFGDATCRVSVGDATVRVVMVAGTGFTHEWLRRTFRGELEEAAREACGMRVEVVWEPGAAVDPPPAVTEEPPLRGRNRRRGGTAGGRSSSSASPAAGTAADPVVERHGLVPRPAVPHSRRPHATLGEFVVGPSNRMAFAAVELMVARPGEMSPLVIHGPSGVGKTHLLEAAGERLRESHPGANIVCLSAEQFTTAFLQALHAGGLPGFRRTCRSADVLVVDDLQFFVGKKATLLEVQQTLDALLRQGRQVVFACDRELDALADLGADLLTRLRGGMVAGVLPPDYDVRRGIVAAIAARRGLALPDDVAHYVATSMTRHARELFGAVNRLEATSLMLGVPVTLDMAREALSDLVRSSARSVRLADIERAVCKAFGIEGGSLQSNRRARSTSHPRMLAMFLARKHTQAALTEIGSYFGRRSHSTVIAAQKTVGEWVATGADVTLADATWNVEEAIRRVEDALRAG